MTEIRSASDQLEALDVVFDLFTESFPAGCTRDAFAESYGALKPGLERRREEDIAIGECAERLRLPRPSTDPERFGAYIRRAVESAGVGIREQIVDAEIADDDEPAPLPDDLPRLLIDHCPDWGARRCNCGWVSDIRVKFTVAWATHVADCIRIAADQPKASTDV